MTPEQQHLRHQMAVHAEQERTARRAMQHEEIKMTSEEYLAARKAEMAAQDEAARAAASRKEAVTAAWAEVESFARQARLPVDRSSIFGSTSRAECGARPARWVETAKLSDDGYRSDGEGGQYFAGVSASAQSVRSVRLELRPDWADRWTAAQASELGISEFVSEFRDALGITAAAQAAAEDARRVASDAAQAAAEADAIRAICDAARKTPSGSGRSPAARRSSATRLADLAAGEAVLAAVSAVECPSEAAREVQAREAAKIRKYVAERKAAADEAARWEAVLDAGDGASTDDIRALIASGWLWNSEASDWQARLNRRAAEARAEKPAQARDALGQGAWGALASLKP